MTVANPPELLAFGRVPGDFPTGVADQGWVTVDLDTSDAPRDFSTICRDYLVTRQELAVDGPATTISNHAII